MSIEAMKRRVKEVGGTSDTTKALTVAGAIGAGVLSGGNPAAISAGAGLGKTVGGMSDQDSTQSQIDDAHKNKMDVVQKPGDDFDKVLGVAQAGGGIYAATPDSKPSTPTTPSVGGSMAPSSYQPSSLDRNAAMKRRMGSFGGY